tara:strand:+ start:15101 stop:16681 length:1581 start_codon:yes stop_codon:yes gene_type:complete
MSIEYLNEKSNVDDVDIVDDDVNDVVNYTPFAQDPSTRSKNFIKEYSSMIHLFNHEPSEERIKKTQEIWKEYDVIPNLFPGLNAGDIRDMDFLKTLPLSKKSIVRFDGSGRLGAYGLAGSWYQCLVDAYNRKLPFLLFMEDDAVPLRQLSPEDFHATFMKLVDNLPNPKGIYQFTSTIYCKRREINKKKKLETVKWKKMDVQKNRISGCTAMLYPRASIKKFLDHIRKKKITKPIDHLGYIFRHSCYKLDGLSSENGMFKGIFEQINCDCGDRTNIMKTIKSNSKKHTVLNVITALTIPWLTILNAHKKPRLLLPFVVPSDFDVTQAGNAIEGVLYINLAHREDRRLHIEKELKNLETICKTTERIDAVKHKIGAKGCAKSHIKALNRAKTQGWKNVLIVEDDVIFRKDAALSIAYAMHSHDFDVLLVAGNIYSASKLDIDGLSKAVKVQTTACYLVKADYYDKLIASYTKSSKNLTHKTKAPQWAIDKHWFKLQKRHNWLVFNPTLAYQRPDYSDIEHKRVDYGV